MSYSPQEPTSNQPPIPPPGLFLVPQDEVRPDSETVVDDDDYKSVTLVDGLVDDAELDRLTSTAEPERKVIPDWVKDAGAVKETFIGWLTLKCRLVAFHLLRTHVYVGRLVKLSPLGAWRLLTMWALWVSDGEFKEDHKSVISSGDNVLKHKKDHRSVVQIRGLTSLALFLFGFAVLLVTASMIHTGFVVVGVLAALCGLGAYGKPATSSPILERASYKVYQAPPFNESILMEALIQCGAEPKGSRSIQVIQPPTKIKSGWEAVVSIGIEASVVIERRSRFASVLNRPENCVWLSSDTEESAAWLRVVVTKKSLRKTRTAAWPFLYSGEFNWFSDEVPIGINETGLPVAVKKAYKSTVYGGIMGGGKTVAMINSVLGQAVDPRVELHLYDLKGGTDWEPFASIAHTYISGSETEHHVAVIKDLKALNKRMDKRFRTLKELPDDLKSPKTNDELASMKRLDLHPILINIDETQEIFEFAKDAKLYQELVSRLVKKGRAVGIVIEAGTQEVTKKTLPIASLCAWRHCLAVQGHGAVDLVLGTGAYRAGFNADALTPEDVGIGYFGSGKEISVVKGYFIDPDNGDLDNVVARLRRERTKTGRLTGMAAGEEIQDDIQESTLDLVARSWPEASDKLQWVELVNILNSSAPKDYPNVVDLSKDVPTDVAKAVESLGSQLLRDGVKSKDVRSRFAPKKGQTSTVRKGVHWTDIATALDNRAGLDKPLQLDRELDGELDTTVDDKSSLSNFGSLDIEDDDDQFDTDLDMDDIADLDGGA